jgi:hypothetical protein
MSTRWKTSCARHRRDEALVRDKLLEALNRAYEYFVLLRAVGY